MRVSVLVRAPEAAANMAALMSLSQLSSGSPVYESYYRQVDRGGTGRVGPAEGALFLKKSGLSDSTLGKIWELADPDGKGYLDKQGFFVALRLVALAQNGKDVSIASLKFPVAPPKFNDASSPSQSAASSTGDSHWSIKPEDRAKFDGVFESLSPVNGLLSGDKVKPMLMNSKLPLDMLGRIWDLSDIDKDGHLDRDEFAVAMYLVYRAREMEPPPSSLPPSLIPPSKRKKIGGTLPGSVPVLPSLSASTPPPKDSLRSTPSHGSAGSLTSTGSLSPKPSQPAVTWVVPLADRGRYDELFVKLDSDLDGLVGGGEVKEIFMQSGLPQTMLAHIWTLADTKQKGKLSQEQFSLAMHLVQQKVKKGVDPPQTLSPDMLPPSERGAMASDSSRALGPVEFTGVKELDDISLEIAQLQREKLALEQEIREQEEAIRRKNSDLQVMQGDLERESSGMRDLASQKQDAQGRLEEMDQQRSKLRTIVDDVQLKCQEESQLISSTKVQIEAKEAELQSQEEELGRAKSDLSRLQQEEVQLEQSITAGQSQLDTISRSLRVTQDEINQARSRLAQTKESQEEVTRSIEQCDAALNGGDLNNPSVLALLGGNAELTKVPAFGSHTHDLEADPFHSEDPFKSDPFKDPFGEDPFKESHPFSSSEDFFSKAGQADPFSSSAPLSHSSAPFSHSSALPTKGANFSSSTGFKSKGPGTEAFRKGDPFASSSYGNKGGFADFSKMSQGGSQRFSDDSFGRKQDMQSHGPKKVLPSRPTPPRVWK